MDYQNRAHLRRSRMLNRYWTTYDKQSPSWGRLLERERQMNPIPPEVIYHQLPVDLGTCPLKRRGAIRRKRTTGSSTNPEPQSWWLRLPIIGWLLQRIRTLVLNRRTNGGR
ncbi:C protein [Scophthalmus maximus rhabdovirus]|nr:C protein [Scophthalmus maximus rhabdovirus]ADU05403.1 C protein [Scophthalmus maximus rhabdovirus]